jgi:hypothetical protein
VFGVTSLLNFDRIVSRADIKSKLARNRKNSADSLPARQVDLPSRWLNASDVTGGAADEVRRLGQTMRAASNHKVVQPGWQPRPGDASPRLSRLKGCPNAVRGYCLRAVVRHPAASARGSAVVFAFLKIVLRQNRKASRRKIVTHIIDARQFFLSTTIGALGGKAAEALRRSRRAYSKSGLHGLVGSWWAT